MQGAENSEDEETWYKKQVEYWDVSLPWLKYSETRDFNRWGPWWLRSCSY